MADDAYAFHTQQPMTAGQAAPAPRPAAPTNAPAPVQARERTESSGLRAIALFNEAKAAGEEHVTVFLKTLELVVKQAREIVDGREVYPAGVRDICEKLTEHSASRAQAIFSIMRPEGPTRPPAPFEATTAEPVLSLDEADLELEMELGEPVFGRRG